MSTVRFTQIDEDGTNKLNISERLWLKVSACL